jgi:HD-like signal output (HDOD) protein
MHEQQHLKVESDVRRLFDVNRPLPALSPKLLGLLESLSSDDVGVEQISAMLEHYPSVVARLLYLANSAWSAPHRPITNTLDACTRLGVKIVRSVSIGLVVSSPFNPSRCPGFDLTRYWASALLMAEVADRLTVFVRRPDRLQAAAVRTAALLSNLGVLCMADRLPVESCKAFEPQTGSSIESLLAVQRAYLDTDYCQVGGYIAMIWGLPTPLPECLAHHRDAEYQGGGGGRCCPGQDRSRPRRQCVSYRSPPPGGTRVLDPGGPGCTGYG